MKNEVKRTFNPEFLNRLDEIIIFTGAERSRPDPDSRADGHSAQPEPGAEVDHRHGCGRSETWILDQT